MFNKSLKIDLAEARRYNDELISSLDALWSAKREQAAEIERLRADLAATYTNLQNAGQSKKSLEQLAKSLTDSIRAKDAYIQALAEVVDRLQAEKDNAL